MLSGGDLLVANAVPDAVRVGRRESSFTIDMVNPSDRAVSFRWELVLQDSPNEATTDHFASWLVPPDSQAWPIATEIPAGGRTSWEIGLSSPPDGIGPGRYRLRPHIDLSGASTGTVTVSTFTVEVLASLPVRAMQWVRRHLLTIVIVVVIAFCVVLGWWLLVGRYTTVPNLSGYTQQQAQSALSSEDLKGVFSDEFSANAPSGVVISQEPAMLSRAERGTEVAAILAENAVVPQVAGLTTADAAKALAGADLTPRYREEPSTQRYGTVLGTEPSENSRVPLRSDVYLRVAAVDFNELAGRQLTEVRKALERRGLQVRAYYWDVGQIIDGTQGTCRSASDGVSRPCVAVAFGGPSSDGVVDVGVVAQ